jgi:hypothetical protein
MSAALGSRARLATTCLLGVALLLSSPPPPLVPRHAMVDDSSGSGNNGSPANNNYQGSILVTVPAIVPTRLDANASLQEVVVAPTQLASTAGTAIKLSDNEWWVPQQTALETFLFSTGPPEVARYNFNLMRRMLKTELARRQPSQIRCILENAMALRCRSCSLATSRGICSLHPSHAKTAQILTVRTGALVSRARVLHIRSRVAKSLRGFRHQDPSHA